MNFILSEKIAILKTMESIIMADGVFHKDEKAFLLALLSTFNMSIEEAKRGTESFSLENSLHIISNLSSEKKDYVKSIATKFAIIDGEMHTNELMLLMPLFDLLS